MSAQAAPRDDKKAPHLRLVHSRPISWIADATLADTRAYVETMNQAWAALAALSVPEHVLAPAAAPQSRQFSVTPQAFPAGARLRLSVGGAGLEIA